MSQVMIIDSSGANLASIKYCIERLGYDVKVSSCLEELKYAQKLILPGVGHAQVAMKKLDELKLTEYLRSTSQDLLGICLGMQLLFEKSHEGHVDCLGILEGEVIPFVSQPGFRVPHMGWNLLQFSENTHPLVQDLEADKAWVYFVHSYYLPMQRNTLAYSTYMEKVSAIVGKGNRWGCQFHPERSGKVGAQILKNFIEAKF